MRRVTTALGVALVALAPGVGLAEDTLLSPTDDRVRLSLGVMRVGTTTNFELDSSAGTPGTFVRAEDALGLDRTRYEPWFEATLRAGTRHRVRFNYFSLDRIAARTLTSGPISFGDTTLLTGDPVQSEANLRAIGLTYGYSFVHNAKFELAATLGVNSMELSATERVTTASRRIYASGSFAGPFPTPGIDATWVVSPRFSFDANAEYLRAAARHVGGSLGVYELDAVYRLRPNISFALGYHAFDGSFRSRRVGKVGFGDLHAQGPQAFVRVAF